MKNFFVLVKLPGFSSDGSKLSARASALKLLECGYWPIFNRTRNKKLMKTGDEIAVYLGGPYNQIIIATATIASIEDWDRKHARNYPLFMDGIPEKVLNLSSATILKQPVDVIEKINELSFMPENKLKWGVAFMGGARRVNERDFQIITSAS